MNDMFAEVLNQIQQEEQQNLIICCCLSALVGRAGGSVEIPFEEADERAKNGALKIHIDHKNNKFVISAISIDECRQAVEIQQAMAEKESSEVQ